CHLLNSTSPGAGGPINVELPSNYIDVPRVNRLTVSGCLFEGNSCTVAGTWSGVRAVSSPNVDLQVEIIDSVFRNNDGTLGNSGSGAASLIHVTPPPYTIDDLPPVTMSLRNVTIEDNIFLQAGAVYSFHPRATVRIEDCEIVNNSTNPANGHIVSNNPSTTGECELH